MDKTLYVYINNNLEGSLTNNENGKISFQYDKNAEMPLSLSLPLQNELYTEEKCHGFFNGLLPENDETRRMIARKYGINANSDFAILKAIGYDCPGAISFISDKSNSELAEYYEIKGKAINTEELEKFINELPQKPLGTGVKDLRLSLAGAQTKTAVLLINNEIYLPDRHTPTSHILKPAIKGLKETVENEYICLKVAEKLGIRTPEVKICNAGKTKFLLIERFDREIQNNKIKRLHQEDFCQALNIASAYKYEIDGGVNFHQAFELLKRTSKPAIYIKEFINLIIFNYLILNNDAHGKNFSLLHLENGKIELAPAYDILCTKAYAKTTNNMAMSIGDCYNVGNITPVHFKRLANDVGISYPQLCKIIKSQCESIPDIVKEVSEGFENKIGNTILQLISKHCNKNLKLLSK